MNKKLKVLHVLFELGTGGVETLLYNYYSNMDCTQIHFDFLIHNKSKEVGEIEKKVLSMGSSVYRVTPAIDNLLINSFEICRIISKHNYDIIHVHTKNFSFIPLFIAKCKGIRTRICHSHSMLPRKKFFYNQFSILFQFLTSAFSNYKFACSTQAGKSLFKKKKFTIIPNAINIEKFKFNKKIRNNEREKIPARKKFIIALIGRFDRNKNHKFAIKVFNELNNRRNDTLMVFIGNRKGKEYNDINNEIKKLNLEDKIIFMDYRFDIWNFYQGIDFLLLPSISEGFGMVTIEAQIAGLQCLCSKAVPQDTKISNKIDYLDLKDDINIWADKILEYMNRINTNRADGQYLLNPNFNIKNAARDLEEFYLTRGNLYGKQNLS